MDVIAIDNNPDAIAKVSKYLPTAFVADSTDENALRELGIRDIDAVIVAYGDNKEASILTTVILREFGIEQIIVRVDDDYYVPIMKKLGATDVITPQKAAGQALANRLGNEDFKDYYKLDAKYSVISIIINPGFVPVTLRELNSKEVYGVSIVLIMRNNKSFVPGGNDSLLPDDTIFVVGTTRDIKNFREEVNGRKKNKK